MQTREIGQPAQWTKALARVQAEHITVTNTRLFHHVNSGNDGAIFTVTGSDGVTRYQVDFEATAYGAFIGCSCKGADKGFRCKHACAALVKLGYLDQPETPVIQPVAA